MQIIDFNSKSYNIVHVISKTNSNNIELIKQKYSADVAFANATNIYFGQEIIDVEGDECNFSELSLSDIVPSILSLNYSQVQMESIINKIKYHLPTYTLTEIKQEIIKYINDEIQTCN